MRYCDAVFGVAPLSSVIAPRVALRRKGRALVTIGLTAFAIWTSAAAKPLDVLASRYDDGRTGANLQETLLTPEKLKDNFGKLFTYDLNYNNMPGGDVYAQPLFVYNISIPGKGLVNLVVV